MKNSVFYLKNALAFIVFASLGPVLSAQALNEAQIVLSPSPVSQQKTLADDPVRVEVPASLLKTAQKMRKESAYLVLCLENGHYLKMPIRDLDIREFLREYMQNLDFLKMFFTAADVQYYQDIFSGSIDALLHEGVLLPANTIYHETFVPRANARLEWIKNRMEQPFDLSTNETFNPDRSKESWPESLEEADKLWEKRLKFDLIGQIMGYDHAEKELQKAFEEGAAIDDDNIRSEEEDIITEISEDGDEETPKTFEEKLAKAKKEVLKRYTSVIANITKNDAMEIQEIFLNSLTNLYDPHSSFLSEYQLEEFDISVRNSLVGIGALLQEKDGYCTVSELIAGGPAEKSRLINPGDKIVGIGQETGDIIDVVGNKLRNTVRLIRGKEGSKVRLQIESKGSSTPKIVTITREEVQLTTKLAKANIFELAVGDKTVPVGVIELLAFYGEGDFGGETRGFSTTADVEELIGKLKERGVQGIILDMRKNGGGILGEAVDLAGLFIRTGPILQVRDAKGQIKHLRDDDPKVAWDGPLLIMVSRLSASAAEIVAGALQNHERAIIIGDKNTYGKGTVQVVYKLSNFDPSQKSAAKVTIQKWYLPSGESIQVKGVHSDIVLPSMFEYLELGEDKKDHVLPWDAIDPASIRAGFGYGQGEGGAKLLEELKSRSEARRGTLDEFKFLNDRIGWFKERQDEKERSLNYETREKQLRADEIFSDSMKKRQRELAKENLIGAEILLDSVIAKDKESKAAKDAKNQDGASKTGEATVANADGEKAAIESVKPAKSKSDKDDALDIDVNMRESLRVMADWLSIVDKASKN